MGRQPALRVTSERWAACPWRQWVAVVVAMLGWQQHATALPGYRIVCLRIGDACDAERGCYWRTQWSVEEAEEAEVAASRGAERSRVCDGLASFCDGSVEL